MKKKLALILIAVLFFATLPLASAQDAPCDAEGLLFLQGDLAEWQDEANEIISRYEAVQFTSEAGGMLGEVQGLIRDVEEAFTDVPDCAHDEVLVLYMEITNLRMSIFWDGLGSFSAALPDTQELAPTFMQYSEVSLQSAKGWREVLRGQVIQSDQR